MLYLEEAITTFFLVCLLILLQRPDWAQLLIDVVNQVIAVIWQLVAGIFHLTPDPPIQFDASSAGTWGLFLILMLAVAALIGRVGLPSYYNKGEFFIVKWLMAISRKIGVRSETGSGSVFV